MTVILRLCFPVALGLLLLIGLPSPLAVSINQISNAESRRRQRDGGDRDGVTLPFEIVRIVNENKKASEEAHDSKQVDLGQTWQRLGIESGPFDSCAGDCSATVYRSELDGQPKQEVIIKLTQSFNFCRFLVFSEGPSNKSEWIFRGHVDHDFNRYEMASHRVLKFRDKPWLVIRGQEGSGSGFSQYGETWYEVGKKGVRRVLWYPRDGHTDPWPSGLSRDFKADVAIGNSEQLLINYEVTYSALNYRAGKSSKLFVNHHRACYIWDAGDSSFIFSKTCADISEEEIAAIANIESLKDESEPVQQIGGTKFYSASETRAFVGGGYDVFLKYNFSGLLKIAKAKDHILREWLRLYLNDCQDSAEKKKLELALVNK